MSYADKRDTYVRNGLAIISPYGGIWTDTIFQRPEEAMKYLNEFWKGKSERIKEYKLAIATLTITLDRPVGEPTFIDLPQS